MLVSRARKRVGDFFNRTGIALTGQTPDEAVPLEAVRAAAVCAVVGVDAHRVQRTRVVHLAGRLAVPSNAGLRHGAVIVAVATR